MTLIGKSFSYLLATFIVAFLTCCCFIAANSSQTPDRIVSNVNLHANTESKTVKIGNTKFKNYNIAQSHYQPTQIGQLVINGPKQKKVLRKTRQPTPEEMAIKRRIQEVYRATRTEFNGQSSPHLDLLGRILSVLNPKYIATKKLQEVAFVDALNPNTYVDLPAPEELPQEEPLELSANYDTPIAHQLDALAARFGELIHWDGGFVEKLANSADEELNWTQLSFKRLVLCLSQPNLCYPLQDQQPAVGQLEPDSDMIDTDSSEINEISTALPGQNVADIAELFSRHVQPGAALNRVTELLDKQNRFVQDAYTPTLALVARQQSQKLASNSNKQRGYLTRFNEKLSRGLNSIRSRFKLKGQPRPFLDTRQS